jgi:hypothetical protein
MARSENTLTKDWMRSIFVTSGQECTRISYPQPFEVHQTPLHSLKVTARYTISSGIICSFFFEDEAECAVIQY